MNSKIDLIDYSTKNDYSILVFKQKKGSRLNIELENEMPFFMKTSTNIFGKTRSTKNLSEEADNLLKECSRDNWDSEGAKTLNKDSVAFAKKLIDLIPNGYVLPELVPEPTGELGLEWKSEKYHLVLSMNSLGKLAFAIRKPNGTQRGIIDFDSSIPNDIFTMIKENF